MRKCETAELSGVFVDHWRRRMGLADWIIEVTVQPVPDDAVKAQCVVQGEYRRLDITIDHRRIADEVELEDVIIHEMLHAVLSPLEELWPAIEAYFEEEKAVGRAVRVAYTNAIERTVTRLERLFT